MANYTLTTSPQEVGRNTSSTIGARLLAWYTNAGSSNAVVHLKLQAISQGTTYVGTNKDYELTLDSTATGTISWPDTIPQDTWIDVREITQTIAYGRTVNVTGKVWSYVYGDVWVSGNTVTLNSPYVAPTKPTVSAVADSATQISITYGTTSFGNPSTGTVYLYGGTSAAPTTQITSKTTTGNSTYTYTGLSPNTTYYFRARANNGQLNSSYSTEVSATTPSARALYGSVSGQTKAITKLYGPVEKMTDFTPSTTDSYGLIQSFDKQTFLSKMESDHPDLLLKPTVAGGSLRLICASLGGTYAYQLALRDSAQQIITFLTYNTANTELYGFTLTPASSTTAGKIAYILFASQVYGANGTKEITKLYGSVGGVTKRIF